MIRFLLARLGEVCGVMLAVSFLIYLVLEHDAASVAAKVIGQYSTDDQRALWLAENGYNAPFIERYLRWLGRFVTGDWGNSSHFREQVAVLLPQHLARTGVLAGTAFAIIVPLAFMFGIAAGVREGSTADRVITFISVGTTSIPEFASAVFLSAIFVFWLGILPGASMMTTGFEWQQLVLPCMVIVLYDFGYVARMVRARAVAAMRRTGGVEVSTSAHAVTAGAIAFFMHMKTVFGVGFEAAHFTTDQHLAAGLYESNAAAGGVANGRLQLRAGARGGRCAGAGAQQGG